MLQVRKKELLFILGLIFSLNSFKFLWRTEEVFQCRKNILCFIVFYLGMLYIYVYLKRPFLSCQKSLFQSEAKCEWIFIVVQLTRKVLHLASFWKWESLEFGNAPSFILKSPERNIPLINSSLSCARTHYPCQQPNTFHDRSKVILLSSSFLCFSVCY